METQSYQDWSLSVHDRVVAQRVPIDGSMEVTKRCNLTCVHCYNNLPLSDQQARRTELTLGEHCRILDEMAAEGCLWLLYTGGEIFVRKDFLDIYAYAKKTGFLITLFTNATLITPAVAEYLATWRPFSVEVSLYGCTAATHDRVTGVAGSFDRTMRGVRLLMEVGLPPILKTMVLKPNTHEIWDMKRFVEEELGLEFRFDAMINPRVDSSLAPLSVRLSPQEVVELDLKEPNRKNEWVKFCEHFKRPAHNPEEGVELYACGGGSQRFCDRRFRKAEHLRALARRNLRPQERQLQGRLGGVPAEGEQEEGHSKDKVPGLRAKEHVRHVPCKRGA